MNKKYLAVLILAAAMVGLVYSIEHTARPAPEHQPGAAAAAPAAAPTPMPTVPVPGSGPSGH